MPRSWTIPLALLATSCTPGEPASTRLPVGEHRLAVQGGTIWYRIAGEGTGAPVVLLHGGPGFTSHYLKPFEDLGDDRQVVRYDQLGSGKSEMVTDTVLFTIPRFVAELDSLRAALGVETWHVFGHSWGSMLAVEYYRAHPGRVASLILGSPVFEAQAFARYADSLVGTLSDSAQRAVGLAEASGRFDAPAYQAAMNDFYGRYVFRRPVQADLDSSLAAFSQAVYGYMWGPSEFTLTGTLRSFDVRSVLGQIRVPVLVTVGEFDEVGPELIRQGTATIPGARFEVLAGAAHMTPWDARDENLRIVREFLRAADSAGTGPR